MYHFSVAHAKTWLRLLKVTSDAQSKNVMLCVESYDGKHFVSGCDGRLAFASRAGAVDDVAEPGVYAFTVAELDLALKKAKLERSIAVALSLDARHKLEDDPDYSESETARIARLCRENFFAPDKLEAIASDYHPATIRGFSGKMLEAAVGDGAECRLAAGMLHPANYEWHRPVYIFNRTLPDTICVIMPISGDDAPDVTASIARQFWA